MKPVRSSLAKFFRSRVFMPVFTSVVLGPFAGSLQAQEPEQRKGEMAGYLIIPNKRVAAEYDGGFSMYIAAWPLLERYPGQRFQSGLPGTWMFAKPRAEKVKDLYSDIEGGLGWWRDTEYATETPKFIMGGVAPNFAEWANGPGAGKNRDWSGSFGKYGIAQLSPWLLWPPDGLNLKQGMQGEWLGYGYLPLPLADEKTTTEGKDVATGNQCWTLFLNSKNFKGPVAFFTPYFWSKWAIEQERFRGELLDTRPSDPNRALQMETQHIPSVQGTDAKGNVYARVTPVQFPCDREGRSALVHRVTSYNRSAVWESVKEWFAGGASFDGAIDPSNAMVHEFKEGGYATWQIYPDGTKNKEDKMKVDWGKLATPAIHESNTVGYRWDPTWVRQKENEGKTLAVLPEFYRLVKGEGDKSQWVPVREEEVPEETGLRKVVFEKVRNSKPKTYSTPDQADSSWKAPGPKAGPFTVDVGDGSRLTYY